MVKTFVRFGVSAALGLALALPFMHIAPVHAQTPPIPPPPEGFDPQNPIDTRFSDNVALGQNDIRDAAGELINIALGFLGIIAVIIILYGGFKWMTASGNDEKVSEAKRLIIAGIIGLAIILAAYAITTFVLESLISATGAGA